MKRSLSLLKYYLFSNLDRGCDSALDSLCARIFLPFIIIILILEFGFGISIF